MYGRVQHISYWTLSSRVYDMMFSQLKIGNVQKGIKEVVKCQKVAKI